MRQIGSMSARKWPGRWGPRLRLAAVAGLLVAVGTTARAEWVTLDYPGTPNDVEVWAPGVYSVSTNQGFWFAPGDGGVPVFTPTADFSRGTYRNGEGCLLSFQSSGAVVGSPCAPTGGSILPTSDLQRVKATESGAAYAVGPDPAPGDTWIGFTPDVSQGGAVRPWSPRELVSSLAATKALGVLRLESSDDALVGLRDQIDASAHLRWYRNGVFQSSYVLAPPPGDTREVQAIDLFLGGGTTPTALVGWTDGLRRGALVAGGGNPFTPVPLPLSPGAWMVTGVDVNTGAGSAAYGDGFGMATAVRPGEVALLSAVPSAVPEQIGTQWQVNPTYPPAASAPRYLDCHGAEFCVVAQNKADTGNVLVYTNRFAPWLTVDPETSVLEGTTRVIPIRAGDLDGDALRLTVEPRTADTQTLALSTEEVPGGVDLQLTGKTVCADDSLRVTVTATDGLRRHEQSRSFDVQVLHTRRPAPPGVSSSLTVVHAGQVAPAITAMPAPGEPCPISRYIWSAVTPGAGPLTPRGATLDTADFPFIENLCVATGASYVYSVRAVDSAGLISDPTEFTFQVRPWGPPLAPFDAGRSVSLNAGQAHTLVPILEHGCLGIPGYPGVDTVWELTQGQLPHPLIRLRSEDGTLITGTSAVTSRLTVETDACAAAELEFSVRHYTRDGSGLEGPASPVQVSVDPQLIPLASGELVVTSLPEQTTAERIAGSVTLEKINCVRQRGLQAHLLLESEEGSVVDSDTVSLPGDWEFVLQKQCEGRTLRVRGSVVGGSGIQAEAATGLEPGGSVGISQWVAEATVNVPAVKIPLEPKASLRLTATCGEAARGTLDQTLPPGPCADRPLTWQQLGGPALTQVSYVGQRIDVATQETDFGALIGQSVVLKITADTGEVTEIEQPVPIVAEPFLEVSRRTERPTGAETELIGVSVELRNTTACGVREVQHTERLEGVDYVPGSARFDGVPVPAELEGAGLTVRGLVLEGGATGRLTYVVRPRLLGPRRFEGQALLRGVVISRPPEAPASGCGCAGGGSGAAALGLAGLAAALRRRRRG
jgi:uncharacterized protein (TIGR03382 family)